MADHAALVTVRKAVELIQAQAGGFTCELERWHDIAPDECPLVSVEVGPDIAVSEFGTDAVNHIDSLLTLYTDIYVAAVRVDAMAQAFDVRTAIHKALLADPTLGLSAVHTVRYGGAEEVEREPAKATQCLMYRVVWQAHYRTSYADPTA